MIFFYNSKTKKTEALQPRHRNKVTMYSCGPTVYNFIHIGNARSFIIADLIKRALVFNKYSVHHVMNITDIDDKTIRNSQAQKMLLSDFTQKYTQEFFHDCQHLNILPADSYPRATEYISEMIVMIQELLDQDFAYQAEDGVYYRLEKFSAYGTFSDIHTTTHQVRNTQDEYTKESASDFVLWKLWKPEDGDNVWDSPFGKGRPGWHIECSAMSTAILGHYIDIHTGGIDLRFPHHENEIAQCVVCAKDGNFVGTWIHNEHLLVNGVKMSKSLGNAYTLRDITERGYDPLAFRYMILQSHYQHQMNFTWQGLEASQNALNKIRTFKTKIEAQTTALWRWLTKPDVTYLKRFTEAVNDNLDTPKALSIVWEIIKDDHVIPAKKLRTLQVFDKFLGLGLHQYHRNALQSPPISQEIQELVNQREKARNHKEWAESDRLRDLLRVKGFDIQDTDNGPELKHIDHE